eukprot:scaffold14297_cov113-Skeletonema_dohrnii-CCMP3373.AAC.3
MENCVECIALHGDGVDLEIVTLPASSAGDGGGNTAAAAVDAGEELAHNLLQTIDVIVFQFHSCGSTTAAITKVEEAHGLDGYCSEKRERVMEIESCRAPRQGIEELDLKSNLVLPCGNMEERVWVGREENSVATSLCVCGLLVASSAARCARSAAARSSLLTNPSGSNHHGAYMERQDGSEYWNRRGIM